MPAEKVTLGFFEVQQCNVTVTAAPGAPGAPWDQLTQAGSGAAENNGRHQSRGFGQLVPSELKQHGSVIGGILTLGWKISKNGENAGVRSTRPSKVSGDQ